MSYPTLNKQDAKRILSAYRNGDDTFRIPNSQKQLGPNVDWDAIADELYQEIESLRERFSLKDKEPLYRNFEIFAGIKFHTILPRHPALADPNFWIWLIIRNFVPLLAWRYGPEADLKNYGLGGAQENFLFRLWLRAEIGFDSKDGSYTLSESGDIDFWRSHIFRQSYADGREFARALIKFQFPNGPESKGRLSIKQIREFAKHIKKSRSNLAVEVLSESSASRFIEREWFRVSNSLIVG